MVRMVAIFPLYSIRFPRLGVIPLFVRFLSETRLIFSGSLSPKAFFGGISTDVFLPISIVVRLSSSVLRTHASPITTSFGS